MRKRALLCLWLGVLAVAGSRAQERPYFVTYSHDLEEPGNLEISLKGVQASPKYGNSFLSETLELEYGAKGWWTTELYLAGQHTSNDSTIFTGFRWENRFRPLLREHFINPVLYVEYENTNVGDRSLLEVVGHDSIADLRLSNAEGRSDTEREIELKLILSSNTHGWNIAENFISEKNLVEAEPWEFGYAVGVSRPLALAASAKECTFLPRELRRRGGVVRRIGRPGWLRAAGDLALRGSYDQFQHSPRADHQLLAQFRAECQ